MSGGQSTEKGMSYQKLGLLWELLYRGEEKGKYEAEDDYTILDESGQVKRYVQAKSHAEGQNGRITKSWFVSEVLEHYEELYSSISDENSGLFILLTDAYPGRKLKKWFSLFEYLRENEINLTKLKALDRKKSQRFNTIFNDLEIIESRTEAFNLFLRIKLYKGTPYSTLESKVREELTRLGSTDPQKDLQTLKGYLSERTDEKITREEILEHLDYKDYTSGSSFEEVNNNFKDNLDNKIEDIEDTIEKVQKTENNIKEWNNPRYKGEEAASKFELDKNASDEAKEIREAAVSFEDGKKEARRNLNRVTSELKFAKEGLEKMKHKSEEWDRRSE